MELSSENTGGAVIVKAVGRVDGANARDFHEGLEASIGAGGESMVLDFEGLSYISSAGLRVVLLVAKTLQQQSAKLAVCSLSDSIREVFEISGFDKIVPVYADAGDAMSGLGL
ncbi:MAG: STAS domain-containing protein [Acidimicrobiaceae bacterium]|nr:STAS domain-containing protein [Acidimicrobiaceae bacterium]MDE0607885.1 STAS domain-containing protein [Acidimicrobiaceae bacterium]